MTIVAALLLAAAGGAIAVRMMRRPVTSLPAVYHRLTFRRGMIETARFAPDGHTIFYSASWDGQPPHIFSVQPQSPESKPLGLNDAVVLSVSPAGELAILTGLHDSGLGEREGNLESVTEAGGVPQTILKNAEDADWSPIGKGIAVVRRVNGDDRLEYPIGTVLAETSGAISDVRFSPDGSRIAFIERPDPGSAGGALDMVDVNGGRETLSQDWASLEGLAWSPDGKQVWFTAARHAGQQVYVVNLSGQLRQVAAMAGSLRRMLLVRDDARRGMIEVERGQKNEQDISWLDGSELRDLSADGKTVLFDEAGEAGGVERAIYLRRIGAGDPTRLAAGRALALSPDGKQVLAETPEPDRNLIVLPTAGGAAVSLPKVAVSHLWAAWLPDGKRFVFLGRERGQELRLFVQDVTGGGPRAFSPAGVGGSAALSPDGSRVAVMGPDGNGYLYPVDGGAVPTFRGLTPADRILGWSRYGAALYVAEGTLPVTVFLLRLSSGQKTPLWQLAPANTAGVTHLGTIRVTSDGRFCAYSYRRTFSYLYLAEGLQ
jgi:Tol biopolymer transport system component